MKDWGERVSELMIGEKNNNKKLYTVHCTLYTLLLGCFCLLCMLYSNLSRVLLLVLRSLVCNCCWLAVCIVVVILCVFVVLCVHC